MANRLKAARAQKRLSQRALSQKIGLPQSHISKIENGQVDIQATSLIEFARALGLEIMLVPQNMVPAVEALSRASASKTAAPSPGTAVRDETAAAVDEAHRMLQKTTKDAERFSRALGAEPELARLADTARELNYMRLMSPYTEQVREALKAVALPADVVKQALESHRRVAELLKMPDIARALQAASQAADGLRNIRNALAHGATAPVRRSLPAYRLTDGDDNA